MGTGYDRILEQEKHCQIVMLVMRQLGAPRIVHHAGVARVATRVDQCKGVTMRKMQTHIQRTNGDSNVQNGHPWRHGIRRHVNVQSPSNKAGELHSINGQAILGPCGRITTPPHKRVVVLNHENTR